MKEETETIPRSYVPRRRIGLDVTINMKIFIPKCTDNHSFIGHT